MNAKSIKLYLLFCLSLFVTETFSQDIWTGTRGVVSVQVMHHGGFMINLDSEINHICSPEGTDTILVYPNQNGVTVSGAKSMLSTALIAFSTENKLNILYTNSAGYCWGKNILISK